MSRFPRLTVLVLLLAYGAALLYIGQHAPPHVSRPSPAPATPTATAPTHYISGTLPGVDTRRLEADLVAVRGLRFKKVVPADVVTADQVRRFLDGKLAEETANLDRDQATLRAFGFVHPTFEMKPFVLDLYTEQVGGLYDHHTGRFYLVPDAVKIPKGMEQAEQIMKKMGITVDSILAIHEMDHALQDQHYDLKAFERAVRAARNDDQQLAARSLVEGEATWVMNAYLFSRMGLQMEGMPSIKDMLQAGMAGTEVSYEKLSKSPLIFRKVLIFPYLQGAIFVHDLRRLGPGWQLVNDAWSDLPESTSQVLHPERYYGKRESPPSISFPTMPETLDGWTLSTENTLGELQTGILLDQHLGENPQHSTVVAAWRGDRYRVYRMGEQLAVVWLIDVESDTAAAALHPLIERAMQAHVVPGITRVVQEGKSLLAVHGVPPELEVKLLDMARQAVRTPSSRVPRVALSDAEIAERRAHAPEMKPTIGSVFAGIAALSDMFNATSDFKANGRVWESPALKMKLTEPAGLELTADDLPPFTLLMGHARHGNPMRMFLLQKHPVAGSGMDSQVVAGLSMAMEGLGSKQLPPLQVKGGELRRMEVWGKHRAMGVQMRFMLGFASHHNATVVLWYGTEENDYKSLQSERDELFKSIEFTPAQ